MKAIEAIRVIMEKNGVKFSVLMGRLGVKSNTLANRLSGRGDLTVGKLNEMVRALDYKMVLVPRDTRGNADWYEVE